MSGPGGGREPHGPPGRERKSAHGRWCGARLAFRQGTRPGGPPWAPFRRGRTSCFLIIYSLLLLPKEEARHVHDTTVLSHHLGTLNSRNADTAGLCVLCVDGFSNAPPYYCSASPSRNRTCLHLRTLNRQQTHQPTSQSSHAAVRSCDAETSRSSSLSHQRKGAS